MSLATRCPACGTIFRVVQDQLKVSEGWVRCGQCREVFHGIESLFDLGSEPPVFAPPPRPAPIADTAPPAVVANAPAPAPQSAAASESAADAVAAISDSTLPDHSEMAILPPRQRGTSPTFAARMAARMAEDAGRARAARASTAAEAAVISLFPSASPIPVQEESRPPVAPPEDTLAAPGEGLPDEPSFVVVEDFDDPAPADPVPDAAVPESAITWLPDGAQWSEGVEFVAAHETSSIPENDTEGESASAAEPTASASPASERKQGDDGLADDPHPPAAGHPQDDASSKGDVELPALAAGEPPPGMQALALAQADVPDDDDGEDVGPHTLAAMLPEPIGEWPPRRRRQPKAPLPAIEARQREAAARTDPRFVREARSGERWRRPGVRAGLGFLLFVLVLAGAAQVAWPLRDAIAARWPEIQPALASACDQLGCTLSAPRSLASLALDGSTLTRTDTDRVLLFSADLHNRSNHAVRMPSFDLSFMDLNGQVVARKVLAPSEIGIGQDAIGADAELHVHARLQVDGVDATGFQAEMFYP